jgi:hypothetical protein
MLVGHGTMKQSQENITAMFEATLKFLDEHNNLWSGKTAFVEAVAEAKTEVQAIRQAAATQENLTVGVTDQKTQLRHDLEDQTLDIADQLAALAAKKSDANLAAKVQFTRSSLDQMQDNDLIQTAQQVYELANASASGLQPYGVSADQIKNLSSTTASFDDLKNASRSAFAGRSSATNSVSEMIRKTRSLFRNQLDKMVTPFRKTNAEFYQGYFAARVIVDRVATHATAKAPQAPTRTPMPSATPA